VSVLSRGCLTGFAFLLLSGCGTGSGSASVDRPARPVWCPSGQIVTQPDRYTTRIHGSFDSRTLLGQTTQKAVAEAHQHGCTWRVVRRNGHDLPIFLDARANRIDAAVNHGIVTAVAVY
jgi:hypothetical protein